MREFSQLCEQVAATTKKTEKTRLIAAYLAAHDPVVAGIAAGFLCGRPFPASEEATLQVGGALIWRVISSIASLSGDEISRAYRKTGDTGAATEMVLQGHAASGPALSVIEVEQAFRHIADARGTDAKAAELEALLRRAQPVETKYILKIITGDLRIGSRESLVEEAIAQAFAVKPAEVRRANMMLGDIGEMLRLAREHQLHQAKMRLFHPLKFMLATAAESSAQAFDYFSDAAVEDKYDGVRAQAHCAGGKVKLFSRTLDEITASFPEAAAALEKMPEGVILDGEILAWDASAVSSAAIEAAEEEGVAVAMTRFHSHHRGRALSFSALQKRLGRKNVTREMMERVPVAYVCFDVIYSQGELVIDRPLRERLLILDRVFEKYAATSAAQTGCPVLRAPVAHAASAEDLDAIFDAARARGNEGLMVKDLDAAYQPGRRGKSWLKLKRELATLDVVVTAAEWGNGRKAPWLSDYTFAVRDGERLLNVGKAYSGVTDAEIQQLTAHFLEATLVDYGHHRLVEPDTVFEVAFNNIMRSERHESGYALRFPRIVRIRGDKTAAEIDTLERVREIYESELAQGRVGAKRG
ncbi:MAG: ATP-dependent DNA ligase [Acidobacteriaceae bacterium]